MCQKSALRKAEELAAAFHAEIQSLEVYNARTGRSVRRKYSKLLRHASPEIVLRVAGLLIDKYGYRGWSYELILYHPAAFQRLGAAELEELGHGIDGWGSVDSFGRLLAGPAWKSGLIQDDVIHRWARSDDFWWRRAALVSTVAFNVRSLGGYGDTDKTLAVCRILVADHEEMVVKAMSWALRELVIHDPDAVSAFIIEHENVLASRVKREVRNKLRTGLKNPHRK